VAANKTWKDLVYHHEIHVTLNTLINTSYIVKSQTRLNFNLTDNMLINTARIQVSQLLLIESMHLGPTILECMNIRHHQKLAQCTPLTAVLPAGNKGSDNLLMFLINFKEHKLLQFGGADKIIMSKKIMKVNDLLFQDRNFTFYESISAKFMKISLQI